MDQVRKFALLYLSKHISTAAFLDWLADATSPVVPNKLTLLEQALARSIDLAAAEFTNGDIPESAFRRAVMETVSRNMTSVVYLSSREEV